jgi:hypothetical protein
MKGCSIISSPESLLTFDMTSADVTSRNTRVTLLLCVGRLLSDPLSIWHGQQLDGVIAYSKHIAIAM